MEISEYFEAYRQEIKRYTTLVHEAHDLGQEERVIEIVDEFYELMFNHHQRMREFYEHVQRIKDRTKDSRTGKTLKNLLEYLNSASEKEAQAMNNFVLRSLGIQKL